MNVILHVQCTCTRNRFHMSYLTTTTHVIRILDNEIALLSYKIKLENYTMGQRGSKPSAGEETPKFLILRQIGLDRRSGGRFAQGTGDSI